MSRLRVLRLKGMPPSVLASKSKRPRRADQRRSPIARRDLKPQLSTQRLHRSPRQDCPDTACLYVTAAVCTACFDRGKAQAKRPNTFTGCVADGEVLKPIVGRTHLEDGVPKTPVLRRQNYSGLSFLISAHECQGPQERPQRRPQSNSSSIQLIITTTATLGQKPSTATLQDTATVRMNAITKQYHQSPKNAPRPCTAPAHNKLNAPLCYVQELVHPVDCRCRAKRIRQLVQDNEDTSTFRGSVEA